MANIRAISECFIKPNQIVEESKKPYYMGPYELMQIEQCHLQIGLLFPNKLPSKDGVNGDGTTSSFLDKLKMSLSSTLTHFYPLAGQFTTKVDEEKQECYIYIDCNKGPGAKFIYAVLDDVHVIDVTSPPCVPKTLVQSFFQLGKIPTNYDGHNEPLLVVQVTELADGHFIGVSINHSVVDGTSFWHFFSSWSEMFRSNNATILSKPPIHNCWFPEGYGPIIKVPNIHLDESITRYKQDNDNDSLVREVILHFPYKSIELLKGKANEECGGTNKISSFQALSALIWRSIIRSRGTNINENSSMCVFVANGRSRVKPPQPQKYFGSLIGPSFNPITISELLDKSLGSVALILQKSVQNFDDQYLRDYFIRWMKAPFFYPTPGADLEFILISGSHKEEPYDIEFGFGKAVALRTGSNKYNGKVVFRPSREDKGSVDIEVCLLPDIMTTFQQDKELLSFLD